MIPFTSFREASLWLERFAQGRQCSVLILTRQTVGNDGKFWDSAELPFYTSRRYPKVPQ